MEQYLLTIYTSVFIISLLMLVYVYGGYLFILKILRILMPERIKNHDKKALSTTPSPSSPPVKGGEILLPSPLAGEGKGEGVKENFFPRVTIFFSAFNEEDNVRERIENLLSLDYPKDSMEIVVVSDGSTDKTVQFIQGIIDSNPSRDIRVIEFKENKGKARAQNIVAEEAKYDILLSTDAEARFSKDLLKEIVKPFSEPDVGVVGGRIAFQPENSEIAKSYLLFRSHEDAIQSYESELGIGVHVGGQCVAYRKNIWEPIKEYEDADLVIMLLAKKKGFITVLANNAVCYDKANTKRKQEIVARARMTRLSLLSKLGRWGIRDIVKYPVFTFALFSHKILRYFSPFYLMLLMISGGWLIIYSGYLLESAVIGMSLIFLIISGNFFNIAIFRTASKRFTSFLYANIGFALGVIQWIARIKKGSYKPARLYQ